ncbi:MAG: hypothetical protein ACRC57_07285 [Sarcina sp.]
MMKTKISKKLLEIYKNHNYTLYENLEEIIKQKLTYNDTGFVEIECTLVMEKVLSELSLEESILMDLKYNNNFTYEKISKISNMSLAKIYRKIKKIQKNNVNNRDLILP